MKKTTIETTEVELRGLLAFAHEAPSSRHMHGVIVSEGRLAAVSPFALAVRGDPTLPWVERTIIPYRAIAAACVEHDAGGSSGCDWESEYDLSDHVTIDIDGESFAITRISKSATITITGAVHDVKCPDLGIVVHGLREDALPETLIGPRVFGKLESLGGNSWRMEVAGEGQPVRFTSSDARWTVFSMPMRSGA